VARRETDPRAHSVTGIVDGETAPGFELMRAALSRVVEARGDGGGAAVAAFVQGRPVVDLWGGSLGSDSLVHTWSAVKPVAGACLLHLISLGRLSLDDPLVQIWPELAAGQDGRLRVRHLLSHAAGLATVPLPATGQFLLDWDGMVAGLAAAEPDWVAGEGVGEHAFTFGHLVGEVVRRVDGRSLGRYLAEELSGPLTLDVHVGVGDADLERVAKTVGLTEGWWEEQQGPHGSLRRRAFPDGVNESLVNSELWPRGEVPAVNGHATARGLAGFYVRLLEGRLPSGVDRVGAAGFDLVLGQPAEWTLAGGRVSGPEVGMGGLGGQWGAARRDIGLAWAFLTTAMSSDDPADRLERVLLRCLARQ
jgi:CubicO group peptidase (beta-lactamase class C family)